MRIYKTNNLLNDAGTAIGIGLLAGIAGTVAITISQMIEMKIAKKQQGDAPVKAADKVLGIKPADEGKKELVAQEMHWAYGASWGIARGLISAAGLNGLPASLAHFAAVWGTKLVMFPSLNLAPPVTREKPLTTATDAFHHAVYALAAGMAYDAIKPRAVDTNRLKRKAKKFSVRNLKKIKKALF